MVEQEHTAAQNAAAAPPCNIPERVCGTAAEDTHVASNKRSTDRHEGKGIHFHLHSHQLPLNRHGTSADPESAALTLQCAVRGWFARDERFQKSFADRFDHAAAADAAAAA